MPSYCALSMSSRLAAAVRDPALMRRQHIALGLQVRMARGRRRRGRCAAFSLIQSVLTVLTTEWTRRSTSGPSLAFHGNRSGMVSLKALDYFLEEFERALKTAREHLSESPGYGSTFDARQRVRP